MKKFLQMIILLAAVVFASEAQEKSVTHYQANGYVIVLKEETTPVEKPTYSVDETAITLKHQYNSCTVTVRITGKSTKVCDKNK